MDTDFLISGRIPGMLRAGVGSLLLVILLSLSLQAQSDHPANEHKVLVQDVSVSGTQSLGTEELNDIKGVLTAVAINDDKEEISDRLRMSFQDHGYFSAKVNSVRVRVADPLANPKPVSVEADVTEGPLFHVGEIKFLNNHALSAEDLRKQFPIHRGDTFTRSKIGSGLEAMRDAYGKLGYIDITVVSDSMVHPPMVDLQMDVSEGHQYRLESLMFTGSPELAEQLRPRWQLEFGQPFDGTYIRKFLDENQSLLPRNFNESRAVRIARDCEKDLVTVLIDLDPRHPSNRELKDRGCDKRQ